MQHVAFAGGCAGVVDADGPATARSRNALGVDLAEVLWVFVKPTRKPIAKLRDSSWSNVVTGKKKHMGTCRDVCSHG